LPVSSHAGPVSLATTNAGRVIAVYGVPSAEGHSFLRSAQAPRLNELRATRDDRQASVQADLDDARTVGYAARRAHVLHVGR
jgi:hypothetical protein